MDDAIYKDIILEHWKHPQNYGMIENADIEVQEENPSCGDELHLTATVKNGKIINIKFIGDGCAISKASASLFTEFVKEKTIKEIYQLPKEACLSLVNILLSPTREKCALLVYVALQRGLASLRMI